jgi:hydrogenase/urease accessory protein HupE
MIKNSRMRWIGLLVVWLVMCATANAHTMKQVRSEITIEKGKWQGSIWLEAWAVYPEDGPKIPKGTPGDPNTAGNDWLEDIDLNEHQTMREIAAGFIYHTFLLTLDGQALKAEYSFPDYNEGPFPKLEENESGNALMRIDLQGEFPAEVRGPLALVWDDEENQPLVLEVKIPSAKKSELRRIEAEQEPEVLAKIGKDGKIEVTSDGTSLWTWIVAGFHHIIPLGLDHICFILGLFLLQPKTRPLLLQTTAFTLAHSITLSLVVLGVFSAPSHIVEPLIAISIAYVGIENLWVKELKPWRVGLVFALGLLHGMGFASVMQELDLPEGQVVKPLIGFNLGVEMGQIAVLAMAFAVLIVTTFLMRFAKKYSMNDEMRSWCEKYAKFHIFSKLASALIGLIGLYWTYERVFT